MLNLSRTFKAGLAAATLAAASGAALAEVKDFSVSVAADIPTATFYVTASPGWNPSEVQTFAYTNGSLQTMSRTLEMKSTIGPIKAYLMKAAELTGAASSKIGIDVTVNDQAVNVGNAQAAVILDKDKAAAGQRVSLTLAPKVTGTPAPGVYNGQVALVFDSSI
ncbi:CS1 type fimbrial major subunit [Mitsuaria sp. PDC51]|uniref:CS1 type fimbrial major subunit n=1 Tax=unclassified Roseateles TaxID=2626991 RepID=UPI0008F2AFFE|nr:MULTISPECIES: CS1 type fimbrial major subunit [unclassified Roseateles]MBB3294613.1 hypothetical protein [Mitsuaria sp. BK041]MBB3363829.1 hypothetical protein [Mitsuaria sp. BK045]SFR86409.1 CS1 type fimbrial major subunit [Mitsuaria sp. PDC51]